MKKLISLCLCSIFLFIPCLSTLAIENFESCTINGTTVSTKYGQIKANKKIEILNNGKNESKALVFSGGDNFSATLTLNAPIEEKDIISFCAERWTGQKPFDFSISAELKSGEKVEIYSAKKANKDISTGRFSSDIACDLPAKTTKLHFYLKSPENKGIIIDDLYIECLATTTIAQPITTISDVWPLMIRNKYNPFIEMTIQGKNFKGKNLNEIEVEFSNPASYKSVESAQIHSGYALKESTIPNIIASQKTIAPKINIPISKTTSISSGKNIFTLSFILKSTANLNQKISAKITRCKIGNDWIDVNSNLVSQRIGYAVTVPGDANSKFFRIPGIVQTKTGKLVAVYDHRYNHSGDLPARIDVGVSCSSDGGQTWTPSKVIMKTFKENGFENFGNGIGDPAILCDEKTGWIWVAALTSAKDGHPIWKSVRNSVSPINCGQFILTVSKDDGKTWSDLINITKDIKRLNDSDTKDWGCLFQGPGHGICMKDGTLVFPSQIWGHLGRAPHHGVLVYSKDNGKTWESSKEMPFGGSESTVVETKPGTLLLNTREGAGGWRMVGETNNLGKTWAKHISMNNDKTKLRQPGGCQAALLGVTHTNGKRIYYFSNPNSGSGRKLMTLKTSTDNCETWSAGLLYDARNCWGYSSLATVDNNHIGVLYEGFPGGHTYFLKISYNELNGSDK